MASLCGSAQYPEERSFDWKNVAVARRKALRGRPALAIQRAPIASSPLKCALRRAASPHVLRGEMLTPRTPLAPRDCASVAVRDVDQQRRTNRCAPSLKPRSGAVGRAGAGCFLQALSSRGDRPHPSFAITKLRFVRLRPSSPRRRRAAWGREKISSMPTPSAPPLPCPARHRAAAAPASAASHR